MPFQIVRNDITNMRVDAIVNTTNPDPVIGYGTDASIHQKAGPELLQMRKHSGKLRVGEVIITPGFALPARYVIHTVGPVWRGGSHGESGLLRRCYEKSMRMAVKSGCESLAFPLISAGNHGFPKELALQIAMDTISRFLMKHELQVYLVVFSRDAFRLSEKLFTEVSSFIDDTYVTQTNLLQYGTADKCSVRKLQQERILREQRRVRMEEAAAFQPLEYSDACPQAPAAQSPTLRRPKATLAELLKETDAGFSETLMKLIDRSGKKDSQIYTRANISRQHFSKIRNNPAYKPTKATAIAFAVALELNLEQTRDLIGRAGYALTNSSKFDVIIMYFISRKNYNMFDINAALFEFDQPLLGA